MRANSPSCSPNTHLWLLRYYNCRCHAPRACFLFTLLYCRRLSGMQAANCNAGMAAGRRGGMAARLWKDAEQAGSRADGWRVAGAAAVAALMAAIMVYSTHAFACLPKHFLPSSECLPPHPLSHTYTLHTPHTTPHHLTCRKRAGCTRAFGGVLVGASVDL